MNHHIYGWCEQVDSPFVFGVFFPKVYIPSGIAKDKMLNILLCRDIEQVCDEKVVKGILLRSSSVSKVDSFPPEEAICSELRYRVGLSGKQQLR